MHDRPASQEAAALGDHVDGPLPALLDGHALKEGGALFIDARVVHRVVDVDAVADPRLVVLDAVPRGRVDAPRAGVQHHVIRQDQRYVPVVVEGMDGQQVLQVRAPDREQRFAAL